MAAAKSRVYHKKFKFRLEWNGVTLGHFKTCSELSWEADNVEQREGGSATPNKSPGLINYTDVTLERGVADDDDLWVLAQKTHDAASGTGEAEDDLKMSLDIVQLDRSDAEVRRWKLTGAWVKKFVAGEWDNDASENVMESVVLAYDSFTR